MFGYLDLHLGLPCENAPIAVLMSAVLSQSLDGVQTWALWTVGGPGAQPKHPRWQEPGWG